MTPAVNAQAVAPDLARDVQFPKPGSGCGPAFWQGEETIMNCPFGSAISSISLWVTALLALATRL